MKKTIKAVGVTLGSMYLTVTNASVAFAQAATPRLDVAPPFTPISATDGGFRINDLGLVLQGLLNLVLFVSALLVFAYLVWGGIQWLTSGGDKGKTEEARNKITAAIVGLVVVALSYAIFRVVLYVVGIEDPFTNGLPSNIRLF